MNKQNPLFSAKAKKEFSKKIRSIIRDEEFAKIKEEEKKLKDNAKKLKEEVKKLKEEEKN